MTELIVVDQKDNQIGTEEKLSVHQKGQLHRAFSILIFNSQGEMLLQKRASSKYHSGGLWTNACCSHPRAGEDLLSSANIRLKEEMGFTAELKEVFSFIYMVKLGDLFEHEFDHVFIGKFGKEPKPNQEEAEDWKWIKINDLKKDILEHPDNYTYWFKLILNNDKMEGIIKGQIINQ